MKGRISAQFQLEETEQIIWTGRPSILKGFSKISKFITIFGILMGIGFAAPTWMLIDNLIWFKRTTGSMPVGWYFAFALVIGWLIVLYLIVGRIIVKAFVKSGIRYSITNQRIIEIQRRRSVVVREIRRQDLKNRVVINKKGQVGTIQFNQKYLTGSPFAVLWLEIPSIYRNARSLTLYDVVDVDDALKAIDEA